MAEQIRAALRISQTMDGERERLLGLAKRLAAGLRSHGWETGRSTTQIVPVMLGENERAVSAAEFLQSKGFAVRAVRPPTVPQGSARLRFSLTCGIAENEIVDLENCMSLWREEACRTAAVARA
jgi:8-amino-7-oxononanoate synthase